MRRTVARILVLVLSLCLLVPMLPAQTFAQEDGEAENISSVSLVKEAQSVSSSFPLFDGDMRVTTLIGSNGWMELEHAGGIGSIYLIFSTAYDEIRLSDPVTGEEHSVDVGSMLHKYVDVREYFGTAPERLRITFGAEPVRINEMYVFGPGEVPGWVQKWETCPEGEADLLLFSTHCDDEQLFFAGLLPYYAGELEMKVQVAFFTNHWNVNAYRAHEMLNGLWAVGVRFYPVMGEFPDFFTNSVQNAYDLYRVQGYPKEMLEGFIVEQLRRFRPLVAVGHDLEGEYGHGVHMMYADTLTTALNAAADPNMYPESAEAYGVWDVPKTYLHLYPENQIVMDWDRPLTRFDGKTAYEVTRDLGFPCHASQLNQYRWYFQGADTAKDVQQYSPCEFGLFRSLVGDDVKKDDFFENIPEDYRRASEPASATEPETVPEETQEATVVQETQDQATEPQQTIEETSVSEREQSVQTASIGGNWLIFPAIGVIVLIGLAVAVDRLQKNR